jgi:hypothetical protein
MNQRFSIWAASVAVASALVTPAAVNTTAAAAPRCGTGSLSLSTGLYGAPGDNTQIHFAVILTNISPQSCCRAIPVWTSSGPTGRPTACRDRAAIRSPSPLLPERRPAVA